MSLFCGAILHYAKENEILKHMILETIHLNVSVYQKLRLEIHTFTGTENEQFYDRGGTVWKKKYCLSLTVHRKHIHACALIS